MNVAGGFNGWLRTSYLRSIRLVHWALSLPEWDTHFGFKAVIPSGKDDCFEPPERCCTTQPTHWHKYDNYIIVKFSNNHSILEFFFTVATFSRFLWRPFGLRHLSVCNLWHLPRIETFSEGRLSSFFPPFQKRDMWSLITQHISRLVLRHRIISAVCLRLVTGQNTGCILLKFVQPAFMNVFAPPCCMSCCVCHCSLSWPKTNFLNFL